MYIIIINITFNDIKFSVCIHSKLNVIKSDVYNNLIDKVISNTIDYSLNWYFTNILFNCLF